MVEFTTKLNDVKELLMNQSEFVMMMLNKCIENLAKYNSRVLEEIIQEDENTINNNEIFIEKRCIEIMEKKSLSGKELRLVLMMLRINKELERMADHVVNICKAGIFLCSRSPVKPMLEIQEVSSILGEMFKKSMNSFYSDDTGEALKNIKIDDQIDLMIWKEFKSLTEFMKTYPETVKRVQRLIYIINNIERIGDLCKNICEEIIFIEKGDIIRHKHLSGDDFQYIER